MGKGRERCKNGTSLGGLQRYLLTVGNSEAFERNPKVRITVLKVGTVTPLLGFKLLDPKKKRKSILSSSCDTVVTLSSYTISSSDIATTIL